jgi:hypothetical protein
VGYYINPIMWALAISLSILAGIWTFYAYRRRGLAAGARGAAFVLLPFAALFTGTLTLLMRLIDALTLWATGLVFSPMMWFGLILLAASVGLFALARVLPSRTAKRATTATTPKAVEAADPEMAEIEAILRSRGIT